MTNTNDDIAAERAAAIMIQALELEVIRVTRETLATMEIEFPRDASLVLLMIARGLDFARKLDAVRNAYVLRKAGGEDVDPSVLSADLFAVARREGEEVALVYARSLRPGTTGAPS